MSALTWSIPRPIYRPISSAKPPIQLGLEGNVRVTSTGDFFQHLLPLHAETSGAIPAIHERIKQQFWKDSRWAKFPTEEDGDEKYAKDKSLYHQSFVELANAVCLACKEFGLVNDDCVQGVWVAGSNNQSCENSGADSFKARPGIVHVSQESTLAALDTCLAKGSGSDPEKMTLDEACMTRVWWSQVHTQIEITAKPSDGVATNKAVLQLCSYMHQVLGNQLDRRFVFGILLCGEQLSLWFYDKSGLIGTLDPIHIHKDTMEFIRVLVALKTQSASRLGWDPTMKVYQSPTVNGCPRDPIPSYRMVPEPADFTSITYQANWVISMPTKDDPNQREDFVTIRHPITLHIKACTTATVVWEVVKLRDIDMADRQIFILKQQWQYLDVREDLKKTWRENQLRMKRWKKRNRDEDEGDEVEKPLEAAMYDQAGIGDRLWSEEVLSDETASTLTIRTDLNERTLRRAVEEWDWALKRSNESQNVKVESGSSVDMTPRSPRLEHKPHLLFSSRLKYDIFSNRIQSEVKFRVQTRLIFLNAGFSLVNFLDLLELLQVIRGAVKDHEKLYFSGVLHRDISIGNIIIFPKKNGINSEDEDCGMLIDFDHAKCAHENWNLVIHGPPSEEQCAELEEHFRSTVKFDREVLVHAWQYHGKMDITKRFLKMLHYFEYGYREDQDSDEDDLPTVTMKQLGWETRHQWRPYVPVFYSKHEHMDAVGTLPFMSAHVANWWPHEWEKRLWRHRAEDDTESLLWVIIFICIYYRGPGCNRHQELESEDTGLHKAVHKIFYGDLKDVRHVKDKLMRIPELFKENILDRFHPYFDPLKGMVQKWYSIQRRLYVDNSFGTNEGDHIHTYIRGLLDETIEEVKKNPPAEEHPGTAKIRERRKKQIEDWQTLLRNLVPDQAHQRNRKLGTLDADDDSEPRRKKLRLPDSQESRKEGDANAEERLEIQQEVC